MPRSSRTVSVLSKALLVVLLVLAGFLARADAQELTGTLYGKVQASDGSILPGATVTISSPQLIGGSEVRTVGAEGTYRLSSLPPGTYTVTVELSGFQTATRSNVTLPAGAAVAVDVQLNVSNVEETVSVVAQVPLVDVKNTQIGKTVDQAALQTIPGGRSFSQIIVTVPGVIDSGYLFAPAQSVQGSSVRDSLYNVDGANANDTAVGNAFMEIPYRDHPGSPGDDRRHFRGVRPVERRGVQLHHQVRRQHRARRFQRLPSERFAQGRQPDARAPRPGTDQPAGVRQELRARLQHRRTDPEGSRVVLQQRPLGRVESAQPDFPARNPTADQVQGFGKLTAQISPSTKVQGSYMQRTLEQFPSNASFATNNAPETWSTGNRNQKIIYAGATHSLGSSTLMDATFSQMLSHTNTTFPVNQPGYIDNATGLSSGGWPGVSGPENRRNNTAVKVMLSTLRQSWAGGSHNFKFGAEANRSPYEQDRILPGDFVHVLRNGLPYRVDLYNTPLEFAANTNRFIAFAQDGWTLRDRVTLNLGVRFEKSVGWLPTQTGGGGQWFPETTYPERDVIHWFVVAPRLGVVWDVTGDKRISLKASYNRYYNAIDTTMALRANNNTASFQEYDWVDLNNDRVFENGEQTILRRNHLQTKNGVDPNLKQAYVDAIQAGFDKEVGSLYGFLVSAIYKHSGNLLESLDSARPFSAYRPDHGVEPGQRSADDDLPAEPRVSGGSAGAVLHQPEQSRRDGPEVLRRDDGGEEAPEQPLAGRCVARARAQLGELRQTASIRRAATASTTTRTT